MVVWQKAMELVGEIYSLTGRLPKIETYILSSQMLRAAISIPSNIAEGYRRSHKQEFLQFLAIAIGSAGELETQVIIAKKQYPQLDYRKIDGLLDEIQRILYVFIKKLKENQTVGV